jgi:hypothetical protein
LEGQEDYINIIDDEMQEVMVEHLRDADRVDLENLEVPD